MSLKNEIFEGIAAYKALTPTAQDKYQGELYKIAKRENDDYEERKRNREEAIARGKPAQATTAAATGVPTALAHSGMPGMPTPALPTEPFNVQQRQTRVDPIGLQQRPTLFRQGGAIRRYAGGGFASGLTQGFNSSFRAPQRERAVITDRWGPRSQPDYDAGVPGSLDAAQNAALTYGPAPAYRRGGAVRRYQEGGSVAEQSIEDQRQLEERQRNRNEGDEIIREMISTRVGEPDVFDPSIELRERAEKDRQAMATKLPPPPTPPGQPVEYTPLSQPPPDPVPEINAQRAELDAKYRSAIPAPPEEGELDASAEYTRLGAEEAAVRRQDDTGLHQESVEYGPPTEAEYEDPLSRAYPRTPRPNIGPPTQVPPPPSEPLPDPRDSLPPPEGKKTSALGRILAPIGRRVRAVGAEVAADVSSGMYNPSTTYGTGDPANAYPDYNEDPELYQRIIRQREIDRLRVGGTEPVSPEEEERRNAEIERIRREGDRPVPTPGTPAYTHPYTGPRNEPAVRTGPPPVPGAPAAAAPGATAAPAAPGATTPAAPAAPGAPAGAPAGARPQVGDVQAQPDGSRLFWNGKAWVPLSQTEQYGPPEQFGPPTPTAAQLQGPAAETMPVSPGGEPMPPPGTKSNGTSGPTGNANAAAPPPGSASANAPTRVEKPALRTDAYDPTRDRRDPTTGATMPRSLDAQGRPVDTQAGSLGSATGYTNGDIATTLNGAATQVRPGVNGGPPPIGHQAADRLIFHQYTQQNSQGGRLQPGEAMLIGMVSDYKTLLKQGRVDEANKMAYSLIQAANLEAASFGMQARDQMARGDYNGAKQSMINGLNYIADGVSQRLSADGQYMESYDPRTGAVTARTPLDGRMVLSAIMGLADGTLFWRTLQASAAMLQKPDTGAEGRALSNELRRRQIALADQRLAGGGRRGGGGGGGTSSATSQFQRDMRKFKGEPDPQPSNSGGGGGGTDDTLAMINFEVRD